MSVTSFVRPVYGSRNRHGGGGATGLLARLAIVSLCAGAAWAAEKTTGATAMDQAAGQEPVRPVVHAAVKPAQQGPAARLPLAETQRTASRTEPAHLPHQKLARISVLFDNGDLAWKSDTGRKGRIGYGAHAFGLHEGQIGFVAAGRFQPSATSLGDVHTFQMAATAEPASLRLTALEPGSERFGTAGSGISAQLAEWGRVRGLPLHLSDGLAASAAMPAQAYAFERQWELASFGYTAYPGLDSLAGAETESASTGAPAAIHTLSASAREPSQAILAVAESLPSVAKLMRREERSASGTARELRSGGTVLAYATPDLDDESASNKGGGMLAKLFGGDGPGTKGLLPKRGSGVAIYDIAAARVYMPNGEVLEAHSGIGHMKDNPKYVHKRMSGPTPPNVYDLRMRERRFHGVEAIRMLPRDRRRMHGRDGMLTHTQLLRRTNGSHGCVAFKNYDRFLKAFKRGHVKTLVVVPRMSEAKKYLASL